jgi:acyl-CoA synthetase (AMP-forming)/AMP-acid ligase II
MQDLTLTAPQPLTTDRLISDHVEGWARERPDAVAVTFQDQEYTWAQWRDRLHRVAGGLRALGVGRGDRVATLDLNSLACLELSYAASSIGAAHVIVNWRLVGDQLAYVLDDSRPRVVFVGAGLVEPFEAAIGRVPELDRAIERVVVVGGESDEYEPWVAGAEPVEPAADVEADDTCLVMYSSGTTGFPKGVELSHRNINTHSEAVKDLFNFDPSTVSLACMPQFHVGGTCYAIAGLHHGAPTVILREVDPGLMFAAIARGATHIFLVPAVVGALLAAGDQAIAAFSRIQCMAYGAAPMPLPMLKRTLAAWPDMRISQVYGMTEMSGVTTALSAEAHRDADHPERLTSAGLPIRGVEMRVVDPLSLEDLPVGEPGEVWFRTAQAMRGYLGKPEATAEAKTPDGWMRTGDVGRLDDGGFLYIIDRLKDMIISGGENVYSPEVENVLAAHPSVGEVAIIGVPDERWGEVVKAVVAPAAGATVDAGELIAFARERLAHYKCPQSIDVVEALPRNPAGKVLKRELRRPYWEGHDRTVV